MRVSLSHTTIWSTDHQRSPVFTGFVPVDAADYCCRCPLRGEGVHVKKKK